MMSKLTPLPFALILLLTFSYAAEAQNKSFPNAIHAKLNFMDYGVLNDEDFKLGQGFEVGYFRNIAPFLNVGVPVKFGLAKLPGTEGNTFTTSVDLVAQLGNMNPEAKVSPYAFGGGGYFVEKFKNGHLQFPFGAGANFRVSRYAFVNVQAEMRISSEENRDNLQLGVGFVTLLHKSDPLPKQPVDTDGDGTPDNLDKCPQASGPASALGCPDSDGDGLTDAEDQCPTEAGTLENNGCPDTDADGVLDKDDPCPDRAGRLNGCPDADNDGIADDDDKCPNEAGPQTNKGCPEKKVEVQTPKVTDRDGDGIPDTEDECPDKAGPFGGCPDTDGDGLADNLDKCPTTPGLIDNFGCPEVKKETKERLAFVTKNVQFETGSALLTRPSYAVLDELKGILAQYPDYKLSISGHTDNIGNVDNNLRLSQERAKACHDYLILKGIAPGRLRSAGFGDQQPIADNNTAQGRELNRRVEFALTLD
jgi:outer membrane protein OmpA-like peptidoglycan-associated protein